MREPDPRLRQPSFHQQLAHQPGIQAVGLRAALGISAGC
jgi:hypothetical protein